MGVLTAAILVAHLPELGLVDPKALASLVGVAPWSRDSGQKRGQRAIRGGRSVVRRALYICAWSVIRKGGTLRHYYQGLRQRGKAWEGCSGSGDAAVVAAAERRGPKGYTLGAGNCVKLSAIHPCDGLDTKHGYCPIFRVHLNASWGTSCIHLEHAIDTLEASANAGGGLDASPTTYVVYSTVLELCFGGCDSHHCSPH